MKNNQCDTGQCFLNFILCITDMRLKKKKCAESLRLEEGHPHNSDKKQTTYI